MWTALGACLVIGSLGLTGIKAASLYSQRSNELRSLQDALQMLDTEILYAATPLPEALKKIGQGRGNSVTKIFSKAGELFGEGQGFTVAEAWEKALQDNWNSSALIQDDYAILCAFGKLLGVSDREEQHKNIALTSMHLRQEEEKARRSQEKNTRLWQYGGFLVGISIVLLLL
ncbi:MAG: stage III sporulation protein SpoIIIAB [Syntrophaceticus sp.]|nr:stage III sporulation protein SpoIIIAB [Syntrophaceticus sp.]MDD3315273.1 stage III sporulation protein SpoIIIAB [Syntrophaceticus sp.]MDD4359710.1 stage III sporulation protein SpoIIIAB [Syntrophaceticus sp.]MDD4782960.1 stage III sporulation protein SpoIIIAB [Syntrophaceticus sp.]HBG22358.1 stage III sporulation protein AB [Peptococcaceae bacterium]